METNDLPPLFFQTLRYRLLWRAVYGPFRHTRCHLVVLRTALSYDDISGNGFCPPKSSRPAFRFWFATVLRTTNSFLWAIFFRFYGLTLVQVTYAPHRPIFLVNLSIVPFTIGCQLGLFLAVSGTWLPRTSAMISAIFAGLALAKSA